MSIEESSFPRVLIVSHNPLSWNQNNGRTMSALFQSWPKGSLSQIYMPFMTRLEPSSDVCQNYWPVTLQGMAWDLFGAQERGLVLESEGAASQAPQAMAGMSRMRGLSSSRRLLKIVEPARELVYASPSVRTRPLLRWAEKQRPEAIFTLMGSIYCIRLAVQLAERFQVPIVPYFTDDWAGTMYEDVYFSGTLRKSLAKGLERILELSPIRFAGGPGLAVEYARRYGGTFIPSPNPADPEDYDPTPRTRNTGEPLRLTYLGNLQLERWSTLKAIGEALQSLSSEGIAAHLDVYCPERDKEQYAEAMNLPTITLRGFVNPTEIPRVLAATDMVCLAEAFDDHNAGYTRFSFATKISEYAMSGRAVLAVGPAGQTSLEAIAASGCGIHVPNPSPAVLADRLRPLLKDEAVLDRMGAAARKVGIEDYSRTAVKQRFESGVRTALERNPFAGG